MGHLTVTEHPMGQGWKANLLIRVPLGRGIAPQSSSVSLSMLRAQTPRLIRIRANHRGCGDPARQLVDPSLPKQQPRRVCNPQLMPMQNRVHGIELSRCVPRFSPTLKLVTLTLGHSLGEVQADRITLPPPPYPPPSRPVYLRRKILISVALSLVL